MTTSLIRECRQAANTFHTHTTIQRRTQSVSNGAGMIALRLSWSLSAAVWDRKRVRMLLLSAKQQRKLGKRRNTSNNNDFRLLLQIIRHSRSNTHTHTHTVRDACTCACNWLQAEHLGTVCRWRRCHRRRSRLSSVVSCIRQANEVGSVRHTHAHELTFTIAVNSATENKQA